MRPQKITVALPSGRTPSAPKTQSSAIRLAMNSARTRPPNSRFARISARTTISDADKAEGKVCVLTTSLPHLVIIEGQYATYRLSSRAASRIDAVRDAVRELASRGLKELDWIS